MHTVTKESVKTLPAVAHARGRTQAEGHLLLVLAQDVGHLLGVRAQAQVGDPDVGVDEVAALDGRAGLPDDRAVLLEAGALDVAIGLEPDVEARVLEALAQVGRHVVGRRDPRRDDAAGEGLRDHGARDAHELGVEGAPAAVRVSIQRMHRDSADTSRARMSSPRHSSRRVRSPWLSRSRRPPRSGSC